MSERHNRPGELRSIEFGGTRATYLPDGAVQLVPDRWFPDSRSADWSAYESYLDGDGNLVAGIGALLIEHDGQALLIDTGFGPHTIDASSTIGPLGKLYGGELPNSFRRAGRAPSDVGTIAVTHPHEDHIGWADRLFAGTPRVGPGTDGEELPGWPGVRRLSTPGHTEGHVAYVVTSGDLRLVVFGDCLHSPVQLNHPQWNAASDTLAEPARRSRQLILDELRQPNTIGFGVHFADVVFGRVVVEGDRLGWEPVD